MAQLSNYFSIKVLDVYVFQCEKRAFLLMIAQDKAKEQGTWFHGFLKTTKYKTHS